MRPLLRSFPLYEPLWGPIDNGGSRGRRVFRDGAPSGSAACCTPGGASLGPRRARTIGPSDAGATAGRRGCGDAQPEGQASKCSMQPTVRALPVLPTRPIRSPVLTRSPSRTEAGRVKWAYRWSARAPRPSITTQFPYSTGSVPRDCYSSAAPAPIGCRCEHPALGRAGHGRPQPKPPVRAPLGTLTTTRCRPTDAGVAEPGPSSPKADLDHPPSRRPVIRTLAPAAAVCRPAQRSRQLVSVGRRSPGDAASLPPRPPRPRPRAPRRRAQSGDERAWPGS